MNGWIADLDANQVSGSVCESERERGGEERERKKGRRRKGEQDNS